jgi:ABC-type uncharacterized transport system substrate-binding protein
MKKVLIIRKDGRDFQVVMDSVMADLNDRYIWSEFLVTRDTEYLSFKRKVEQEKPQLLLLMDNKAILMAQRYNSESKQPVNAVAIMGLNLSQMLAGDKHIAGIAFESPGYSLITQYRFSVDKKVSRVAVVYRESIFRDRFETAARELSREGIVLEPVNVEAIGTKDEEIAQVLNTRVKDLASDSGRVDAIWILLDSVVLSPGLMSKSWFPIIQISRIPILVEAESLVSKEINFGSFAVTPNLADMGNQTAQMVDSILKDGMSPSQIGVERVVSVNRIINLIRLQSLGIKARNLAEVQVIE